MRPLLRAVACAALLLALMALAAPALLAGPAARAQGLQTRSATFRAAAAAGAHALPVHYDPPQNAVLRAPPAHVQITFSEQVNPDISVIVVVDPSNREVDNRDTQVSPDGYTMTVTLPLLPAGTYVVFWRTHSADDGHIAAGSYIFHIARADGTVPPLSGPLPTGHFPGGGGVATTDSLSGPSLFAALAHWAALAGLTLLLGMIFWATVVQPRQRGISTALREETGRAMRRGARWSFVIVLLGTAGEIAGQLVLLDGTLRGLVSGPLWHSVLLQSRFGGFLLARVGLAALGLCALALEERLADRVEVERRAQELSLWAFGLALAFVFEYSGHGGAAPNWWGPLVDYLHLLANGVWLGGLFTLAVVVVPVLRRADAATRTTYLAAGIPAFSEPALVAVGFLIVTGPLNGAVRMSSLQQVWTTPYGLVLVAKSLLFLAMVAISYHHAFRLRPHLAASADTTASPAGDPFPFFAAIESRLLFIARLTHREQGSAVAVSAPLRSTRQGWRSNAELTASIMSWMRAEAALGLGVLLCAALLGPLAGTLAPPVSTTGSFGAQGGAQTLTQKADDLTVTLRVDPGKFGTNTFSVLVYNPDNTPANGASVFLVASMVEMDMGTNTINLTPSGQPGTYSGQGVLSMAGHWRLEAVIRTQQDPTHLHRTTFTIGVSY